MEALLQNLIKATGWSILHSLWQGAVIYGLVMLMQTAIPGMKAKTRYMLAFSGNTLLLLLFMVTFFTVFDLPINEHDRPASALTFAVTDLHPAQSSISQYIERLFPYLVGLYGFGILIQSIRVFQGYRKISNLKRGPHTQIPESWALLFQTLTQKMQISRKVNFWLSDQVQVPMIIGYLKPVVLLPVALATQMDLNQVEAILIHELSHVRRNDYLFNLIRTMIDTVLFFNPFIWLTGKFIDIEREHACDDLVVELTQTPMTYAHALLKLELLAAEHSLPFALAATGNKQYLYQRIKRITDMKTNYMNSKQKLFAITLTVITLLSLAWIKPLKAEGSLHDQSAKMASEIKVSLKKNIDQLVNSSHFLQQQPADTSKKKAKTIGKVKKKQAMDSISVIIIDTALQNDKAISINNEMININKKLSGLNDFSAQSMTINGVQTEKAKKNGTAHQEANTITIKAENDFSFNLEDLGVEQQEFIEKDKKKIAALQKELSVLGKKMELAVKPIHLAKSAKLSQQAKKMGAQMYSAKQQAEIQKISAELAERTMEIHKIIAVNTAKNTNIVAVKGMHTQPMTITLVQEDKEIKESPEYQELKRKFDAEVKALKDRKLQQEKTAH